MRRSTIQATLPLIVALAGASPARALEINDCKSLEDDAKRLACYDQISGRSPGPDAKQMGSVVEGVKGDVSGIGLVARTVPEGTRASTLGERWDLDRGPNPGLFALRPYKPVYVLPAFYSSRANTTATSPNPANNATLAGPIDKLESKFQISLKAKILEDLAVEGGSLWFGYTQSSRWQVYNTGNSRPFRQTDYEPEVMYTAPTDYSLFGVRGRLVGVSLTHQSNGRDIPQSRSWNRVIGQVGLESGDWTYLVRPWLRLREKAEKDDNSDILDYVGRAELIAIRKLGNQQVAVTLRHTLRGGDRSRGSVAVDWAFPLYGYLKGHVQLFSGYGESLIDYNRRQHSIGLGISLEEWL